MANCCCCCCCVLLIVLLSLAILVSCLTLWLFTMRVELNLLSVTLTSGFLMVLSLGLMVSTRFVVLLCGLLSHFSPFTFRNPDRSCDRSSLEYFSRIFSDNFQKDSFFFFFNMNQLSTTAKTTFIYLSVLTGVNLVLILSSDPTTVVVGIACLILSVSSLASFYIDQAMLEQSNI